MQCRSLFVEIMGLIKIAEDGSVKTRDRIWWSFREKKLIALYSRLNSFKSTLSLMLHALKFAKKEKSRTLDPTINVTTSFLQKKDAEVAEELRYLGVLINANRRLMKRLESLEDDQEEEPTRGEANSWCRRISIETEVSQLL